MTAIIRNLATTIGSIRNALAAGTDSCADFRRDPIAHPALDRMSVAELGDIPARELRAQGRE